MPRFVALLRGVNVGKSQRVPMAEFRAVLEGLGGADVRTLLNSGNAVFGHSGRVAARHAQDIAAALHDRLGLEVPTVVIGASDFRTALAENPLELDAGEHSRCLVIFAQQPVALSELEPLLSRVQAPERLVIGRHAAYLHCASGILESKVATALLGRAGRAVTTRNWATALKFAQLLERAPPAGRPS